MLPKANSKQYFADCNDFFAPLDEIVEALMNDEGIAGISNAELKGVIECDDELKGRIKPYIDYWKTV